MSISEYALKFVGRPYIYGGDGSGKCGGGFDCSGLVLECLWALGMLEQKDTTAQGIYDALVKAKWHAPFCPVSKKDDVLFFGMDKKNITHVAIAVDDYRMIEAGGGGSKCKTVATSTGMVRVRPIPDRKDLVAILRE